MPGFLGKLENLSLEESALTSCLSEKTRIVPGATSSKLSNLDSNRLFAKVRVVDQTKGSEICERHLSQVLLRGEQIVLISVVSGNPVGSQVKNE